MEAIGKAKEDQLEKFAQGDLSAFEEIFREYQREIFSWLMRIVRNRTAAEDLTIEVFWKIYCARARFDPRRSFGAWAKRIATNAAIDFLREGKRDEVPFEEQLGYGNSPSPQGEIREAVEKIFRQMPPKLSVTARLAFLEGMNCREISDVMGISHSAAKLRVFRATRIMRSRLKQAGIEP